MSWNVGYSAAEICSCLILSCGHCPPACLYKWLESQSLWLLCPLFWVLEPGFYQRDPSIPRTGQMHSWEQEGVSAQQAEGTPLWAAPPPRDLQSALQTCSYFVIVTLLVTL